MTKEQQVQIDRIISILPAPQTIPDHYYRFLNYSIDMTGDTRPVYAQLITLVFVKSKDGLYWVFDGVASE